MFQVIVTFDYIEFDDPFANCYDLELENVRGLIAGHNECFGTNYQSIEEFNKGEEYRFINAKIRSFNLVD